MGEEQSAPADTAESSTLDDGVSEGGADGLEPGPDVPEEPADSESAEDVGGGEGGEADGSTEPLEDVEGSEGDGTDDTEEPGDEDVSSDAEESNDSAGDNDAEGEPVEADGDAEPVEPEGDGELEGEDGVEGDDDASADGENEGDERSDSVDEPEEQFSTTCEDRCGEPASESGGCGCDSECELLGTCCEDRCDQCTDLCETEPAGSCADACGGPGSDSACFCDSTCSNFGDCCADACEECGVGCAPGEIPETPCTDGLTYAGCCAGDTLVWCENGVTVTVECALGCGVWKEGLSYYDCLSVGDSEPVPEQSGAFPLACDDIQGDPRHVPRIRNATMGMFVTGSSPVWTAFAAPARS